MQVECGPNPWVWLIFWKRNCNANSLISQCFRVIDVSLACDGSRGEWRRVSSLRRRDADGWERQSGNHLMRRRAQT
jgi:hypothetical protein